MRTHHQFLTVLAAALLIAFGAAPGQAGLSQSPQVTISSIPQQQAEYDSVLGDMIAQIDETEIYRTANDLQNFSTRAYSTTGNVQAADYLYHRLSSIPGLDVEYQSDRYHNVIATLRGEDSTSGEVIIVGAHFDSISSDSEYAPGATDNGCGVAIVLDLARVMSRYRYDHTIQFAFWNAEEIGKKGSADYVAHASDKSLPISLYLNYDESCYDPDNQYLLNVLVNENSKSFADLLTDYNSLYGINFKLTKNGPDSCSNTDHRSFWKYGYPALSMTSLGQAPQGHSSSDTIDLISTRFAKKSAQLGLVLLADTAEISPASVRTNPSAEPAVVITMPIPVTTPPENPSDVTNLTVVTPTPQPAFGKRYAVGNPGSFLGSTFGSGGPSTVTGSPGAVIAPTETIKPGNRAYGITPPKGQFFRWYPAARWKAGIK